MYFNGYAGGRCPAGGTHARQAAADYDFVLPYGVPAGGGAQDNWVFCNACNVLYFGGYQGGRCPAGGPHRRQPTADYNFVLPHDIPLKPGSQSNWRFCTKCNALYFNGYAGGRCPAGGTHARQAAADYDFVLPFAGNGVSLSVPPEGQLDAMACWAASLAWMSRAVGSPTAQLDILSLNADLFSPSGGITLNKLVQARSGPLLLNKKRIAPGQLEPIIQAGVFPLLIGYGVGPMGGHANVIHGFDATSREVTAMEPWYPDPSTNPNFRMQSFEGLPVYYNVNTGAPFVFTGIHVRRPITYYTSQPIEGQFIVAIPSSLSFP